MRECRLTQLMAIDSLDQLDKLIINLKGDSVDPVTQDIDRQQAEFAENEVIQAAYDTQIADITNEPLNGDILQAIENAPDGLQDDFSEAFKAGLPLNNIVRRMLKDAATFSVTGEHCE